MILFNLLLNLSTLLNFLPVLSTFEITVLENENHNLISRYIVDYFEVDNN